MELSQQEIARAVTNDAALSENEIVLGDRTFKIVDLPYDDYVQFISSLQPFLQAIASKITSGSGIASDAPSMGIQELLKYCVDSVPALAHIVLRQTDAEITIEEIKRLGKTPFKLAGVVLAQVQQNNIIGDIGDFFVQILPLLPIHRQQ